MISTLPPLMQRVVMSTLVIGALAFTVINSFSPYLSVFVPLLAILLFGSALKEYYDIAKIKGYKPREKTAYSLTIAYIFAIYLGARAGYQDSLPLIALAIGLFALFSAFFFDGKNPLVNIAITLFGIIYLIIPLSCLLQINYFYRLDMIEDGRWWVFYLLAVTYTTDTCALFAGKFFGKNKLAPFISPKKTWEGAIGGLISAIAVSIALAQLSPISMTLTQGITLGTLLGCLAQVGDLAESLLKRDVGVKDSSKIPGLGGMLDVVDSLVFTSPIVYLYLKL